MASPWCSRARDISGIDSALDRAGCVAFRRSTRRFDHAAYRGCNDVELALRMLHAGLLQDLVSAVLDDDGRRINGPRLLHVRWLRSPADARFGPIASEIRHRSEMRCVISDRTQRSKIRAYSITSSARASNVVGTSRPSILAVFRLITTSYLVGACTGRSAAFSPLKMRS